MEVEVIEKLGFQSYEGKEYQKKRILLINPKRKNIMAEAHSYYSKDEKKIAKLNYKNI